MYSIHKDKGNNQNVVLTNEDTKSSIIIGKLDLRIVSVLKGEFIFSEEDETGGSLRLTDEWNKIITSDTATKLLALASPIKKPVRIKPMNKTVRDVLQSEQKKKTKSGKPVVDVFDLIYGISEI